MINELTNDIETFTHQFFKGLKKDPKKFQFLPTKVGTTYQGEELNLGFSCLALKSYFILGLWQDLSEEDRNNWINYINSFQEENASFPQGSYIDEAFLNEYKNKNLQSVIKNQIKNNLNISSKFNYSTDKRKLTDAIRAESKQAISTLFQVGEKNKIKYLNFPQKEEDINLFLNNLNWNFPWSAGAQFSALCVFSKTQLDSNDFEYCKDAYYKFISKIVNNKDGAYYRNRTPNQQELVNGCMKVLTGLDWLDSPIHYPEKLIDMCLNINPSQEGCDIVDIVYVLYRCLNESNYREKEVMSYFNKTIELIEKHYFYGEGGFSYFIHKSQKNYYGLSISTGQDTPDIHGTTLLLWAISMVLNTIEKKSSNWNVIKP